MLQAYSPQLLVEDLVKIESTLSLRGHQSRSHLAFSLKLQPNNSPSKCKLLAQLCIEYRPPTHHMYFVQLPSSTNLCIPVAGHLNVSSTFGDLLIFDRKFSSHVEDFKLNRSSPEHFLSAAFPSSQTQYDWVSIGCSTARLSLCNILHCGS